jgi:hypothetical protein
MYEHGTLPGVLYVDSTIIIGAAEVAARGRRANPSASACINFNISDNMTPLDL